MHARRPGAHPIPGAVMGGAMRQMGRGMPPPPEQVMDIEEIVEATRWIMKSNWGPDQNTSPAVATGIVLGLRARDLTGKGQHIDQSQMVSSLPLNGPALLDFTVIGRSSRRPGFPPGNRAHRAASANLSRNLLSLVASQRQGASNPCGRRDAARGGQEAVNRPWWFSERATDIAQ